MIIAKLAGTGAVLAAGGAVLAVVETTTQSGLVQVVSLAIPSVTAIVLAWIAYKQNVFSKKQDAMAVKQNVMVEKQDHLSIKQEALVGVVDEVKKQTDGITSKLVESTARAFQAEGELKGGADARTRQDAIDLGAGTKTAPAKTEESATLKKIEKNTAETADNTARTEANVQEIKEGQ